ncbi:MAG: hypothetical protein JNG90_10690, partial [Planctomycetaceae bacterium]|nr:hypothetical protein [Planctomycetaceae bacterium]
MLAQTHWLAPAAADWFDSANWDNGVPTDLTDAVIDNDSTSQVAAPGAQARELTVGDDLAGLLEILSGGGLTVANAYVAREADSVGAISLVGPDAVLDTEAVVSEFAIGVGGAGSLSITAGAVVNTSTQLWFGTNIARLGVAATGVGEATIDGAGSTWNISEGLTVGDAGEGKMTISEAGLVASRGTALVADQAGAVGQVSVVGAKSHWQHGANMIIGDQGNATLAISGGALVEANLEQGFFRTSSIAVGADSVSSVTVTGAGSKWYTPGELNVAGGGTAELALSSGGSVYTNKSVVGRDADSSGTVTVAGKASLWHHYEESTIGLEGAGALAVSAGGIVNGGRMTLGAASATGSGEVSVTGLGSQLNAGALFVGAGGSGALTVSAGGVVSTVNVNDDSAVAYGSESHGEVLITGAGSKWTNANALGVGISGVGEMTIEAGGSVATNAGYIGRASGGKGTVTITGEDSAWTGQLLYVGFRGDGTLLVEHQAQVASATGSIGHLSGGNGKATIDGAGAAWTISGNLDVGQAGKGELVIRNGAVVSNVLGRIGYISPSQGKATVTGADSQWLNSGSLDVGSGQLFQNSGGSGALTVEAGGYVGSQGGTVGNFVPGKALVTGADSTWNNSSKLIVGNRSSGELTIAAGALVANASATIASQLGSKGTVVVTGANSRWTNDGELLVGEYGAGQLTISAGAKVSSLSSYVGLWEESSGTVTVTGENSEWSNEGSLVVGLFDQGSVSIAAGGKVTAGEVYAVTHGTIDIGSGGTLDAPIVVTDDGGRIVNHGTITGDVAITNGALVTGTGIFTGSVTVGSGGLFSPGGSPGMASTATTLWDSGGAYRWEINALEAAGGSAGDNPGCDLWHTGDLTIAGPFTIAIASLTLADEPGLLAG